jgi:hypothetical protein
MGENTAVQATGDNTLGCTRFACWITKPTDTHREYLIPTAFSRQQALRERASQLRNTCIAFIVWTFGGQMKIRHALVYESLTSQRNTIK